MCPRPLVLCLKAAEASEAFRMLAAGLPACHARSTDPGTPFPPSPHGPARVRTLKEEAGSPGWRADEAASGLCASGRDQGPELGVRAGDRAQEEQVRLSFRVVSWLCFWLVELLASYPCNGHPGCWGCPTLSLPPRGETLCSGLSPGRRTQSLPPGDPVPASGAPAAGLALVSVVAVLACPPQDTAVPGTPAPFGLRPLGVVPRDVR